jgi:transcriptional regulator with XRE-family HTH domain
MRCTPSSIQATTFFHMLRKFGALKRISLITVFFKGSLGLHLRYCPACLTQDPYYRLIWRFLALPGCSVHGCRFLDRCGHCGNTIPLFIIPSKIGVCPMCNEDLRSCSVNPLSEQEWRSACADTADFEYLLTSHHWEDDDIAKKIGYRLAMLRRERRLSTQQITANLAMPLHELHSIERGDIHRNISFAAYVRYAKFFDVTFQELFEGPIDGGVSTVIPAPPEILVLSPQIQQLVLQPYEDVVLEHLQEAVKSLLSLGQPVTLTTIRKHLNVSADYPQQFTFLKKIWNQRRSDDSDKRRIQYERRENELVKQVQDAIAAIEKLGRTPTYGEIFDQVGLSLNYLSRYKRVMALIKPYSQHWKLHKVRVKKIVKVRSRANPQDENLLVERVHSAIEDLRASGRKVTQKAIGRIIGMSVFTLKSYSRVRAILDQIVQDNRLAS